MNFLSHYYLEQSESNPYYILGALLPDLLKNADKNWRIKPERLPLEIWTDERLQALIKGWNRHLHVDAVFHQSEFFVQEVNILQPLLANILHKTPVRASFLAHISLELSLDYQLIAHRQVHISKLYAALEAINMPLLYHFLLCNDITEPEIYGNYHQKFVARKYLFDYAHLPNISFALQQICKRVWPQAFVDNDIHETLIEVLALYQKSFAQRYFAIFKQMEGCPIH